MLYIKFLLQIIFRKISYFSIYKKNLIIYSCGNFGFSINGKANYYFAKKNFPERKIIFISNKKDKNLIWTYSLIGFIYLHFSKNIITDGGLPFSVNCKNKNVLNTWHGIPLKHIGLDEIHNEKNKIRKKIMTSIMNHIGDNHFLGMGEKYNDIIIKAFSIKKEKIISSLTPYLYQQLVCNKTRKQTNLINFENLNILYLPTYRAHENNINWNLLENSNLIKQLNNLGASIYYKFHPLQNNIIKYPEHIEISADYFSLLDTIDLIITDYSSVIFEMSLLNIPICLYATDITEYEKTRGLYSKSLYSTDITIQFNTDETALINCLVAAMSKKTIKTIKKEYFGDNLIVNKNEISNLLKEGI